jgi:hypothetical protein
MTYFTKTPTGRLRAPKSKRVNEDYSGTVVTVFGGPAPKIGDYVLSSPGVSAGTVGRVTSIKDYGSGAYPGFIGAPNFQWVCDYEGLDGKQHSMWAWALVVIPYSAVQEVKDFYIADGRPERIKVEW